MEGKRPVKKEPTRGEPASDPDRTDKLLLRTQPIVPTQARAVPALVWPAPPYYEFAEPPSRRMTLGSMRGAWRAPSSALK